MEKSLFIAIAVGAMLAIGINATQTMFHNSCECNNNVCDGVANNTAIPNEAGCEHFFICIDGRPIPNTCPQGQWFNYNISQCDNSTNPCGEDQFECPPDGIHFFPHDDYCDKFIMCFAGFPIEMTCAEGLHFDRELGQCNFPEYAQCEMELCPPENDPERIIFLPSEKYCDKYFICHLGYPIKFRCPEGLHFNPDNDSCDFIENANCTIEGPDDPEGPPQPHEIDCDCESIYFVPHPRSCGHYFICSFGRSILLDCAPGFYFDPINFWCDNPENVECAVESDDGVPAPPAPPPSGEPIPPGLPPPGLPPPVNREDYEGSWSKRPMFNKWF